MKRLLQVLSTNYFYYKKKHPKKVTECIQRHNSIEYAAYLDHILTVFFLQEGRNVTSANCTSDNCAMNMQEI